MSEKEKTFKEKLSFEEREAMYKKIMNDEPKMIPVILERHQRSTVKKLDNSK